MQVAGCRFATPVLTTPGEALGEGVNLIVVATGKREQLRDEVFQPSGTPGKPDRSTGEEIGLGNQASALVGVRLIGSNVDGLLAEALDETAAYRGVLDQKRGGAIASLDLHHVPFEGVKRKAAAHHFEDVRYLFANQQNHTSGVIAGFGFAQRYGPAHNDDVAGLSIDGVIGSKPFSFDDRATGRDWGLLVLSRKSDRPHLTL